jgi:ribosomal-protein-alanine N-acetyltransferase
MTVTAPELSYYGFIVEAGNTPIGFTCLRLKDDKSAEMGVGILPQYQGQGYTKEAVRQIVSIAFNEFQCNRVFGDVFVRNPALSFYLHKCGFKAYSVEKKAYYKQGIGMIDTVLIEQLK